MTSWFVEVARSVTRFGEIFPLWQNSISLWAILKAYGSAWEKFITAFPKYHSIGQVSIVIKGSILQNNQTIWSHWWGVSWIPIQSVKKVKLINDMWIKEWHTIQPTTYIKRSSTPKTKGSVTHLSQLARSKHARKISSPMKTC